MPEQVIILGIESSCDETAAAVLHNGKILANITATQEVHGSYGGVVPELASRAHQANIVPVVEQALIAAGITKKELSAVAFTQGPGLLGSLLVGSSFAKAFALGLDIPVIGINHMQAHILALFIPNEKNKEYSPPPFPFLCLTVSGGHTQLVIVSGYTEMNVIGETRDDAAGEAFDKTGKLLGLSYPAGPLMDQLSKQGNASRFSFPIPSVTGLDFSFSGLKTSVLYFLRDQLKDNPEFVTRNLPDLCASVQSTIVDILIDKLKRAVEQTGIRSIGLAGGVSANSELRSRLTNMQKDENWICYFPEMQYCTDNAAMIAMAGYRRFLEGNFSGQDTKANARMDFVSK